MRETIDDGDYELAVDAARDKVATQQATVDRIGRQIVAQQANIDQAGAQMASGKVLTPLNDRSTLRGSSCKSYLHELVET